MNRYKGLTKGNDRALEALGQTRLGKGEATRQMRLRGNKEAIDAFATLTAAERGAVVEAWFGSRNRNPLGTRMTR